MNNNFVFSMEQVIGRHAQNWRGPTKARKELNLYFGWMFYINGIGASIWMIEAAWLQYNNTFYEPHCYGHDLNEQMARDFCLGSWKYFIAGHNEEHPFPERCKIPHFAFMKIAAPVTFLMGLLNVIVIHYWLFAEEGRVSFYVTEYKDKMLPTMEEEAAEQKKIQNIRCQFQQKLKCPKFCSYTYYQNCFF